MLVFILEIKIFFGYINDYVMLLYCNFSYLVYVFFGYLEYLRFFGIIFGSIGLNGLVYTKDRTKSINFLVTSDVIESDRCRTVSEPEF